MFEIFLKFWQIVRQNWMYRSFRRSPKVSQRDPYCPMNSKTDPFEELAKGPKIASMSPKCAKTPNSATFATVPGNVYPSGNPCATCQALYYPARDRTFLRNLALATSQNSVFLCSTLTRGMTPFAETRRMVAPFSTFELIKVHNERKHLL